MIEVHLKGMKEAQRMFEPKVVTKATRLSLNEAVRAGRTEASREIRKVWNIKAAKVNKEVKNIKMAKNTDLTAILQAKGRPISLTYFGAKEVRNIKGRGVLVQDREKGRMLKRSSAQRGVTVQIHRGKKTRLPRAFIATMKSGHIGVFESIKGSRNREGKEKLASKASITIASMFQQKEIQKPTIEAVQDRWAKRFWHHLKRLMG